MGVCGRVRIRILVRFCSLQAISLRSVLLNGGMRVCRVGQIRGSDYKQHVLHVINFLLLPFRSSRLYIAVVSFVASESIRALAQMHMYGDDFTCSLKVARCIA